MRTKLSLILAATTLVATEAAAGALTGTASYRETIAMPPEAVFQAILYDISNNDQVEIGRYQAPGTSGPPYAFTIDYADAAVQADGRYALQVVLFLNDRPHFMAGTVLEGFPATIQEVDLTMVRPTATPANDAPPGRQHLASGSSFRG